MLFDMQQLARINYGKGQNIFYYWQRTENTSKWVFACLPVKLAGKSNIWVNNIPMGHSNVPQITKNMFLIRNFSQSLIYIFSLLS
jgi:hypothetical protein